MDTQKSSWCRALALVESAAADHNGSFCLLVQEMEGNGTESLNTLVALVGLLWQALERLGELEADSSFEFELERRGNVFADTLTKEHY